jgi:hypothetical protein
MEERTKMSIEVSAPTGRIALETSAIPRSDPGYGSARVWAIHEEARRRFPKATGFSINYAGDRPIVTPRYTGASSGTSRGGSSGSTQQERLAARLAEIQHEDLQSRLREIAKTL